MVEASCCSSSLQNYAKYLCRDWNCKYKGEEQLDNFEIFFMSEKTLPNYQTPEVKKVSIHKHYCFKKPEG
ncbi:MAG: hypothetical protein F6K25_14030 [Okeania sp. SIO2G4]|uniref:hypothetical protein n=1 Tax=unclassified Okeania TaxID=2634635 RepID=UPI0013B784F7|nr:MULTISPECIES: hypothetical protein [unclassified Okeania]NEP04397.1 hypothetical protein [Okeania sp. SIO4D6]NEP73065.1 hypothetical protein [Okeania sp. SIO2G5]NEP93929.1 hypothetical protein [Okeania sp. SIO2F5]NEQ91751.1 hypothetical protein [Okeania sp. SIO2G4]